MKTFQHIFQLNLSTKEVVWSKRILAIVMLPILVFYMTSMNFLMMGMMKASAAEPVVEVVADPAPAPKEEPKVEPAAPAPAPAEEPAPVVKEAAPVVKEPAPVVEPAPKVEVVEPVIEPVVEPDPVGETQPTEGVITPEADSTSSPQAASAEAVVADPIAEVVPTETVVAEVPVATPEWKSSADGKTADIGPVELGVVYKAPQNDKVTVTFTKLPEKAGNLTIKEIKLTAEEQLSLGALSDTAYDITSDMTDMTNGDFTYDLTLPYPDKDNDGKAEIGGNSKNEVKADDLQVLYTENEGGDLVKDDMTEVTDQTDANKSKKVIEIKGLNHFTVFVVGWNFPDTPGNAIADGGVVMNSLKTISISAANAPTFNSTMGTGATTYSARADGWDGGSELKYWEVNFNTTGFSSLNVSSKQRSSNTGPRDFKIQYKVGTGGTWTDIGGPISTADNWTTGVISNVSLPVETENKSDIYLRWIMTSNTAVGGGSVASVGASNIDDIRIEGTGANFALTANPTSATITKSAALINTTNQADIETAIQNAKTGGLQPIKVTLTNTGTINSNPVRLISIGDTSKHIQFWTKATDGTNNWYDINVNFWTSAQSFYFPPGYSPMIVDVYAISDVASSYPWKIDLVLVSDLTSIVASTGEGTVTVVDAALAAAKVTAKADVETALSGYLVGNYTGANWTILNAFHTDGDTAIDAALDLAAVDSALSTATGGMAGVATIAETLDAAKVTAKGVLTTALGTYTEGNYSGANWITLTDFKTNGDTAIDAATDLAGVTSAQDTATAGMAGVEQTAAIPTFTTVPTSATITKSAALITTTDQAAINTAIDSAITGGLQPIKVTLKNTGDAASAFVRLVPIGAGSNIQFWTKDTLDVWYNINVNFWLSAQSFSVLFPFNFPADIYAISDETGTYPWTIDLVLVSDPSVVVASTGGTVNVTTPILILTADPTPATITQSALVTATGTQSEINAAVNTAVSGLQPIKVRLQNTGDAASANVRISPIGAGTNIQLWAQDTSNNWYDINITGWGPAGGFSAPVGYDATTDVYAISDVVGSYTLTANLVDATNPSMIITTATGTVNVVDTTLPTVPVLTSPINEAITSNNALLMQWDDSTDTGGSGIAGYEYQVYYNCSDPSSILGSCSGPYKPSLLVNSEYQAGATNDGNYYWQVRAKDNAGNFSNWSGLKKVTIDTTLPSLPGIPSTTTPTNLLFQTWNWTPASDLNDIFQYLWQIPGYSSGIVLGTSLTTSLGEGIWSFFVKAQDNAGNQSGEVSSATLTVDTNTPTSSISVQGDLEETKNIIGNTKWFESFDNVNLKIDIGDQSSDVIYYQVLDGDVSCPNQSSSDYISVAHDTNLASLINSKTDGAYSLCYFAKDLAGNAEATTHKELLKKDNTNPTFFIDSVSGGLVDGVYYNSTGVTAQITVNDPLSGYSHARYDLYNASSNHSCTTLIGTNKDTASSAANPATRTLSKTGLSDGNYCLRVWTYDKVQNKGLTDSSGYNGWIKFSIDNATPTITVINPNSTPAQSKIVTASTNEGILTMFVNAAGISTCDVSLEGSFVDYADMTFSDEVDNTKTICYKATDAASNITYMLSGVITGIDRTQPVAPSLVSPIDDDFVKGNPVQSWSSVGDADHYVYESWKTSDTTNIANRIYSQDNLTTTSRTVGGNQNITFWWRVKAVDLAGNASAWSTPWKVTVDNTAPTITINNPDTTFAKSKVITANGGDGTLTQSITTGDICNGDLTFADYSDLTFSSDSDNGKKVCYKSEDTASNITYKLSDAIGGIDTTVPTTPTSDPVAKDYMTDQLVTLASTDSGSGLEGIYYTTDGSVPDKTKTRYASAITVDKDMTIKAIAYDKVGNASGILEAVYGIAPIISVEVPAVSGESHLDITWHTDDPATSRVVWDVVSHPVLGDAPYYGYANSTVEDSNKVTEHSVVVVVPHSDTTYYYRVISGGSPDAASPEFSIATDRDEGTSVGGNGNGNNNVVANATNVTGAGTLATPQTIGDEQVQGEQSAELEQGKINNEMVAGEQVAKEPVAKKNSIWKNVWTYIIIAVVLIPGIWWLARRKRNSRPGIIQ